MITDPLRNVDMGPMIVVVDVLDACNGVDLLAKELVSIPRSLDEVKWSQADHRITSRCLVGSDIENTSLDALPAWDSQKRWD